jgi:hypothetical protein
VSDIPLSALERINDVCDRFVEAWLAGRRPRVADFLRDAPEGDRPELRRELLGVAVFYLKAEQRRRWEQGERVAVADYLREEPELREGPEQILALVANEVALRRERDERPRPEDYLALLPGHEAELLRLCADGLATVPSANGTPPVPDTVWPAAGAETPRGSGRPGEPVPPDLSPYRPVAFIGWGGVGDVFLYYDPHMGRHLAVKVLQEKHRGNPSLVRRFRHEARINARLQHPGVVPVHAMERTADGRPYFTMKLVQGRTLAALLAERASPAQDLPEFLAIFEQVCQAVAYAHSQGVIHHDLKPANVMVGAFGEVQVMDWGVGKVLGPAAEGEAAPPGRETVARAPGTTMDVGGETQRGHTLGTLAYMPPEQAWGEVGRVDRRSDVFGMGAILCEVLTGQPPFGGKGPEEVWARAQACDHAEALARLDGCGADDQLVRLCKACLAAEPADRPGGAGEVAQAVAAYQAEVQEQLRRAELEKAAAEARAAGERRRRLLAVGLTAALVFAVGLAATAGSATWLWHRAEDAADREKLARGQAEQARQAEAEARAGEQRALRDLRVVLCSQRVGRAHQEWRENEPDRAEQLLQACPVELRGWEWRYVYRLCHSDLCTLDGHAGPVYGLCLSPDGKRLATPLQDKTARVWDLRTGQVGLTLKGHGGVVSGVCFSPDGSRLATASKEARVWGASPVSQVPQQKSDSPAH